MQLALATTATMPLRGARQKLTTQQAASGAGVPHRPLSAPAEPRLVLGLPAGGYITTQQRTEQVWDGTETAADIPAVASAPSLVTARNRHDRPRSSTLPRKRGQKRRPNICKDKLGPPTKVSSPRSAKPAQPRLTPYNAPASITVVPARTTAVQTMNRNLCRGSISASEVGEVMAACSGLTDPPPAKGGGRTQSAPPSRRTAWKRQLEAERQSRQAKSVLACWNSTNRDNNPSRTNHFSGRRSSMDDASSRIGDTRPLPTMNALRRPPAAAEARRVLAGKEDVMVALPWIHAIAASVREAQAEERQVSPRRKHHGNATDSVTLI